jgi:general secretion pathway protein J
MSRHEVGTWGKLRQRCRSWLQPAISDASQAKASSYRQSRSWDKDNYTKSDHDLHHPSKRTFSSGFTLIEVLIAVVIFALMAAVAYRGLGAILETKRQVDVENEKWRRIALLFTRLERDLAVVVPRPIRDATKPYADALTGEAVVVCDNCAQLAFTRMGSADETSTLAAPQRVGYRLRNGNVELLLWPVLDQAPRTTPEANILIGDIADLKFQYLDKQRQWQTRWPQTTAQTDGGSPELPKAVKVDVTLKSGEALTRLFDISITGQPPGST